MDQSHLRRQLRHMTKPHGKGSRQTLPGIRHNPTGLHEEYKTRNQINEGVKE